MSGRSKKPPRPMQWRLEMLGHALAERVVAWLPAVWVFRLGESLGGLAWYLMPLRRRLVLRNLRIAFSGEHSLEELERLARDSFRRTGANLFSAARTAGLAPERLGEVIEVENLGLLEQAVADGRGVVLLLSHMGNWEILSRLIHFFPPGSRAGAFYRPLNNPVLDARVLERRQADGTRMFSKRDNPLHVAAFLREGGIVGILADQRVGSKGELVRFFGRMTRASPLPSLLARRARCEVLALSLATMAPGRWRAGFERVDSPATTERCMAALERAMRVSRVDVFWFQERWKMYLRPPATIRDWLEYGGSVEGRKHRALLWLADVSGSWRIPEAWVHPDVEYELVAQSSQPIPEGLPDITRVHRVDCTGQGSVRKQIVMMDRAASLPLDFILLPTSNRCLVAAAKREAIPVISLS